MSELSSSQKITPSSNIGIKNPETRNPFSGGQRLPAGGGNKERFTGNFSYEDTFKSTAPNSATRNPAHLLNKTETITQNIRNVFSDPTPGRFANNPVLNFMSSAQQGVAAFINSMQANTQAFANKFLSRFVDISDKISAVYGEREKELREKLSDSYKQMELKIYELLGKIDASMQQKEHRQEKKYKDPDEKTDKHTHRID